MELNKLKKLNELLAEFENDCADGLLDGMSVNDLMVEVATCVKLQEYRMMVDYMDRQVNYYRDGLPTDINFMNTDFVLSFGTKTISINLNDNTFDTIRELLVNEIDAIERGI